MSLTEDWKEKKLKSGFYYIKDFSSSPVIDYFNVLGNSSFWSTYENVEVEEILDKVPSYSDLKKLKEENDFLDEKCKEFLQNESELVVENVRMKNQIAEVSQKVEDLRQNLTSNKGDLEQLQKENEALMEKLDIAVEALENINFMTQNNNPLCIPVIKNQTKLVLEKIEEIN